MGAVQYGCPIRLSNTLDTSFCTSFCLAALEGAWEAALAPGNPVIFNTDQGVQFTRAAYTSRLEQAGIQISWDGRGRALDNEFVERLWRALKWEMVSSQMTNSVSCALAACN